MGSETGLKPVLKLHKKVTLPPGGSNSPSFVMVQVGEGTFVDKPNYQEFLKPLPVQFASEFSDPPRGRVTYPLLRYADCVTC